MEPSSNDASQACSKKVRGVRVISQTSIVQIRVVRERSPTFPPVRILYDCTPYNVMKGSLHCAQPSFAAAIMADLLYIGPSSVLS